jgi:hypothetical protein
VRQLNGAWTSGLGCPNKLKETGNPAMIFCSMDTEDWTEQC